MGTEVIDVTAGQSAREIAKAVNDKVSATGVSATATTKANISSVATGNVSFSLTGADGTAVAVTAQISDSSNLTSLAEAINAKSATTGITAELNDGRDEIVLTSAKGDDILIADATNQDGADTTTVMKVGGLKADGTASGAAVDLADSDSTGAAAVTDSTRVSGQLEFSSAESFSVTAAATGGLFAATNNTGTIQSVDSIDITTQAGSNSAINVIDGALDRINSLRATLGAVQTRFESTISNLSTTSENLSAANSRILDADFAAETANLAKSQVLQQAGISVLAQANARPQQVLSLLQ